ncbi:MAG: SulP family inorganic anion transporter [Alphaproteobacteria bacterium]|nr:SulP family inorganic anion transporter [Alphaproteobacteria bacterium]
MNLTLPTGRDLLASVVVFLVALPLCMGIAIASGVPPALGLITGIVGGLVVGFLAGSPLQVSGPAAGLAVIVWELVQSWGIEALGVIVLIGGGIQLVAGLARLGRWFRAVSPAVIYGMLAGIGVLIFGSQFHVMLDDSPKGNGLENLSTIPAAIFDGLWPLDGSAHHMAAMIGVVTIIALVGWDNLRPKALHAVPGALIGVIAATIIAQLAGLPIQYVSVPDSLTGALNVPTAGAFALLSEPSIWAAGVALAVIASAESLLCATAVDQLHDGERTDYDRELAAQGVGNLICGALGALPMTGVIVRSSANVEAGAKSRWSAILHGGWLLGLIVAAPFVLAMIPRASLAAILVYIGYKLVNVDNIRRLRRFGWGEVAVYGATVATIVATDLLTGVLVGLGLALARLLWRTAALAIDTRTDEDGVTVLTLGGVASFVTLPLLADALESLPEDRPVRVDTHGLRHIDQASVELLDGWRNQRAGRGVVVILEDAEALMARTRSEDVRAA